MTVSLFDMDQIFADLLGVAAIAGHIALMKRELGNYGFFFFTGEKT